MSSATLRKVPKENLAVSTPVWWLEARFHFSFADYYSKDNISFGALRVLNDDTVKPGGSFGRHPHKDAEIVTYVVQGQLSHQKDGGQPETVGPGSIQFLSAGTGLMHQESNQGTEALRYIQLWLTPDQKGRRARYGSLALAPELQPDRLVHAAKGRGPVPPWGCIHGTGAAAEINADANVFVSRCKPGASLELRLQPQRQAYLVCMEGEVRVSGTALCAGDALEAQAPEHEHFPLSFTIQPQGAHLLLVEMARER